MAPQLRLAVRASVKKQGFYFLLYIRTHVDLGLLRSQLDTRFFAVGDRLLYRPVVDSTNVLAMRIAHEGLDEGVVVLTDSQTAGKGRQGRRWVDVSGRNVLSSTLLRPLFPPQLLVMIASLAVVNAIAETCGTSAIIKWPNDILIEDRKVAGRLDTGADSGCAAGARAVRVRTLRLAGGHSIHVVHAFAGHSGRRFGIGAQGRQVDVLRDSTGRSRGP